MEGKDHLGMAKPVKESDNSWSGPHYGKVKHYGIYESGE